jgi:hypothetical protein
MEAGFSQRRVRDGGSRVEERMDRPRAEMSATEEYMLPALFDRFRNHTSQEM